MSDDRFDVLERLAPLFEAPETPFEGFVRRRDRKRRNQRIAAGVVGLAVFVASVWIVTTGGPFDRTGTPGSSGPVVAPDGPGKVGLVGLAPEGATPSSPSRGELVLSAFFAHSGGDPGRFHFNVYADGRLIWQQLGDASARRPSTGLIEQQLTLDRGLAPTAGREEVRAAQEVFELGLVADAGHDRFPSCSRM